MATGAWTPYLLPFTKNFSVRPPIRFFICDRSSRIFSCRSVFHFFGADISTTGYYGFPLNQGVVKIANHGPRPRDVTRFS